MFVCVYALCVYGGGNILSEDLSYNEKYIFLYVEKEISFVSNSIKVLSLSMIVLIDLIFIYK